MNEEINVIEIKNIFKNKVVLHVPLKYMIRAIKVEVCNLFFIKVNVDLYEVVLEGLIPGKVYENLCLKIYYTNDKFLKLNINQFKTQDGNEIENMIVNFYREFMKKEIGENKFNYWNENINLGKKTLEQFFNHVLNINKFSIGKLNDMEFLNCLYKMLIGDLKNDLLYFWVFYFEFNLKGLNQIEKRKEIFKKMFEEYNSNINKEKLIYH